MHVVALFSSNFVDPVAYNDYCRSLDLDHCGSTDKWKRGFRGSKLIYEESSNVYSKSVKPIQSYERRSDKSYSSFFGPRVCIL